MRKDEKLNLLSTKTKKTIKQHQRTVTMKACTNHNSTDNQVTNQQIFKIQLKQQSKITLKEIKTIILRTLKQSLKGQSTNLVQRIMMASEICLRLSKLASVKTNSLSNSSPRGTQNKLSYNADPFQFFSLLCLMLFLLLLLVVVVVLSCFDVGEGEDGGQGALARKLCSFTATTAMRKRRRRRRRRSRE